MSKRKYIFVVMFLLIMCLVSGCAEVENPKAIKEIETEDETIVKLSDTMTVITTVTKTERDGRLIIKTQKETITNRKNSNDELVSHSKIEVETIEEDLR